MGECTVLRALTETCLQLCLQETYGSTQMRGQLEHVVYVSVGSERRQVGPSACPCAVLASASRASCL